jgi:hypothetical protein
MVPLEQRMPYLKRIGEGTKLCAFYSLLKNVLVSLPVNEDMSEVDEQFVRIVHSLQTNDASQFKQIYGVKSKSKPNKESPLPFVNDDFLLFCLIVGIAKFDADKDWVKNVISIRGRNPVTVTFENILNDNYYSRSNIPEVILIYLNLTNKPLPANEFLNDTYRNISGNPTLFENKSDFQILCAIMAHDLIINLKEVPKDGEVYLLRQFRERFTKRIKFVSWVLQIGVFIGLLYVLFSLPLYTPEVVALIDKYSYVFTILGALGLSLLGNQIPFVRTKSQELVMRSLGYPKGLDEESSMKRVSQTQNR